MIVPKKEKKAKEKRGKSKSKAETINTADLIRMIAYKTGFNIEDTGEIIRSIRDVLAKCLSEEKIVILYDIGKFQIVHRRSSVNFYNIPQVWKIRPEDKFLKFKVDEGFRRQIFGPRGIPNFDDLEILEKRDSPYVNRLKKYPKTQFPEMFDENGNRIADKKEDDSSNTVEDNNE